MYRDRCGLLLCRYAVLVCEIVFRDSVLISSVWRLGGLFLIGGVLMFFDRSLYVPLPRDDDLAMNGS